MNRKIISVVAALAMLVSSFSTSFAATDSATVLTTQGSTYQDVNGHWASEAIYKWSSYGVVKGNGGFFRPNDSITRGEMACILNNIMDYQSASKNTFTDLKAGKFYTDSVLKANASGIMMGDGATLLRPTDKITREEAAVMMAKAFAVNEGTINKTTFKDAGEVASWAKTSVFGMESKGYIKGNTGKYNPKANITRAETVAIINNVVKGYYTKAGTYTDNVVGTAVIKVSNVILKGITISGDLIIAEGVGQGDSTLDSVTVKGNTVVRGGGENSIHITGTSGITNIRIEKIGDKLRIVVADGNTVKDIEIAQGEEIIITGSVGTLEIGASNATVYATAANISSVKVAGGDSTFIVNKESKIGPVSVDNTAKNTAIKTEKGAVVGTVTAAAKTAISGEGAVEKVVLNEGANNSSVSTPNTQTTVAAGVTGATGGGGVAIPAGSSATNNATGNGATPVAQIPAPVPISGGGGGNNGGNPAPTVEIVTVSAITVTVVNDATAVVNGGTLQMSVTVTPDNATNKTITWSVTNGTGTATIDTSTGLLTATGVGTVTVKATNVSSGINGTLVVTVIGTQTEPLGLVGISPTIPGANDGKITGTTTLMEYKVSTGPAIWIPATETQINGLAAGTYSVRYAAKVGYNAGTVVDVVILADDNSYLSASTIGTDGNPLSRAIYPKDDVNWVKFSALADKGYKVETFNLVDDTMDTYIELYSTDGTTLIYYNDDYEGLKSSIYWNCKIAGIYYVRIMHYNHIDGEDGEDGEGTGSYDISISEQAVVDTTSPLFIDAYPKAANVGANSFDVLVNSDETITFYFIKYAKDGSRATPTADQVIAGTDGNGSNSNATYGQYGFVLGNTEETLNFTDLIGETEYDVFIVAVDAWQNKSTVKKVSVTTLEDTTPPVFIETYPKASNLEENSFDVLVSADEVATYYFIEYAKDTSRTDPTVDQVIAGTDGNGSNSNATFGYYGPISENSEEALSFTDLNIGTEYDVFIVAVDASDNKQETVTKVSLTTLDTNTEHLVTLTVKNDQGNVVSGAAIYVYEYDENNDSYTPVSFIGEDGSVGAPITYDDGTCIFLLVSGKYIYDVVADGYYDIKGVSLNVNTYDGEYELDATLSKVLCLQTASVNVAGTDIDDSDSYRNVTLSKDGLTGTIDLSDVTSKLEYIKIGANKGSTLELTSPEILTGISTIDLIDPVCTFSVSSLLGLDIPVDLSALQALAKIDEDGDDNTITLTGTLTEDFSSSPNSSVVKLVIKVN